MQNDLYNELAQNFIEYSVAVNSDRAIPDARDGLKPVAKRILYGAYINGYTFNKPHVKCANIVGQVMAEFHPHGDSSIYGALVRLSQNWVMRYPLIDFHGANGNQAGDGPAAARYTEGRLAKIVEDGMLFGLKKNVVDTIPNYSETKDEPVSLPSIFPNLLCNPNVGIGVACAATWLPHNLNEVAQVIYDYMDDKPITFLAPDFPTGGIIINKKDIPSIVKTGHGSVKLRAKYKIEDNKIIFTELPYGIATEALMAQIGDVCDKEIITGAEEVRDESNKKGIRLVVECEKNANLQRIINQLFKETDLQTSISYNQVALINKTPTDLNLIDCLKIYVDYNSQCLIREAQFDKSKAEKRVHIIDGLLKALNYIDEIIDLIKNSNSVNDAKVNLQEKYSFTEAQVEAILEMKLARLAKMERSDLEKERQELLDKIKKWIEIIENPQPELRKRLQDLVQKYGDARRTELVDLEIPKEDKIIEYIEPEKCVVTLSEAGNLRRIATKNFKPQRKGGKGVKNTDEITKTVIRTNTIDNLMVFSDKGIMYKILVDDVPEGAKGTSVRALTPMSANEKPATIYSIYHETDAKFVLFVTKNGIVKKTGLAEFSEMKKKSGVAAIKLREDDELVAVSLIKNEDIILLTHNGYAIRFNSEEIAPSSRNTIGVKGITLGKDDYVVSALPVRNSDDDCAIFSSTGLAKRIKLDDLPKQGRGGKGLNCLKVTGATGFAQDMQLVCDDDYVLIVGEKSNICVSAKDIAVQGRTAQGTIIGKCGKVSGVSKV